MLIEWWASKSQAFLVYFAWLLLFIMTKLKKILMSTFSVSKLLSSGNVMQNLIVQNKHFTIKKSLICKIMLVLSYGMDLKVTL